MDDPDEDVEDVEDWEHLPDPHPFEIGLEGRLWTVDRWDSLAHVLPEKMELIGGKLYWTERERLGMLGALLENMGLRAAVRLAPKERWLEALRELDAETPADDPRT